jgi:hypothetical protein
MIEAGDGGTTPPGLVDDVGQLQFSSGLNKRSGSLETRGQVAFNCGEWRRKTVCDNNG